MECANTGRGSVCTEETLQGSVLPVQCTLSTVLSTPSTVHTEYSAHWVQCRLYTLLSPLPERSHITYGGSHRTWGLVLHRADLGSAHGRILTLLDWHLLQAKLWNFGWGNISGGDRDRFLERRERDGCGRERPGDRDLEIGGLWRFIRERRRGYRIPWAKGNDIRNIVWVNIWDKKEWHLYLCIHMEIFWDKCIKRERANLKVTESLLIIEYTACVPRPICVSHHFLSPYLLAYNQEKD